MCVLAVSGISQEGVHERGQAGLRIERFEPFSPQAQSEHLVPQDDDLRTRLAFSFWTRSDGSWRAAPEMPLVLLGLPDVLLNLGSNGAYVCILHSQRKFLSHCYLQFEECKGTPMVRLVDNADSGMYACAIEVADLGQEEKMSERRARYT